MEKEYSQELINAGAKLIYHLNTQHSDESVEEMSFYDMMMLERNDEDVILL